MEVIHNVDQVTKKPAVNPANRLWNDQSKTTVQESVSWNAVAMNFIKTQATPIPIKAPTALEIMPSKAPS